MATGSDPLHPPTTTAMSRAATAANLLRARVMTHLPDAVPSGVLAIGITPSVGL